MTRFLAAIGNAPVDLITAAPDSFLTTHGMQKGQCIQLDLTQAKALQAALPDWQALPGGAVGNALACYATLGGRSAHIGPLVDDALGRLYLADLHKRGIAWGNPLWPDGDLGTTRVFCVTTPDTERSFASYAGTNLRVDPSTLVPHMLEQTDFALLDGFAMVGPRMAETFHAVLDHMEANNGNSAMMVGDISMLRDFAARINPVLARVQGLFLNEVEAAYIYGDKPLADLAQSVADNYRFGAMTCGALGAYVFADGTLLHVPLPRIVSVVDTNGAGDNFTGGFLYGLRHGYTLEQAATIGHLCAGSVIGHFGARLAHDFKLDKKALPDA